MYLPTTTSHMCPVFGNVTTISAPCEIHACTAPCQAPRGPGRTLSFSLSVKLPPLCPSAGACSSLFLLSLLTCRLVMQWAGINRCIDCSGRGLFVLHACWLGSSQGLRDLKPRTLCVPVDSPSQSSQTGSSQRPPPVGSGHSCPFACPQGGSSSLGGLVHYFCPANVTSPSVSPLLGIVPPAPRTLLTPGASLPLSPSLSFLEQNSIALHPTPFFTLASL